MLITLARIKNYKRVRDVEIRPAADVHLLLLAGPNMAGKTSVLDAIDVAIGGKHAQARDPVHHGAEQSEIDIEFDGGALTVRRVIQPDGETSLEVRGKDGAVRSPQAVLDKLLGPTRFLDPLQFLRIDAKDQRARLLALIDGEGKLRDLEVRRERIFEKRTEVGRDLKKAEGELARLPVAEVGVAVDVAALSAERAALADKQRAGDGLGLAARESAAAVARGRADLDKANAAIADLERKLADVRRSRDEIEQAMVELTAGSARLEAAVATAAEEWGGLRVRAEEIASELARADAHNRAVFATEAGNKRRDEASDVVAKLGKLRDQQTKMLDDIETQKVAFLSAASLPVAGLGVEAAGITLNGVPFAQASGAEKLRVAVALAMASASGLDDVLIRDAALLDDDSLRLVGELAEAAGKRLWLERVGTNDAGAIVIRDGAVVP